MAQWITRLTTDQKILGSTPGWLDNLFSRLIQRKDGLDDENELNNPELTVHSGHKI